MTTVLLGDCRDVMAGMEAASVDAVITDPPYGLSFMGKGWDHGVPGEEFWVAARRVAKPGSYLLAFGGTRTFHRLACAIEDAGWRIQDCLSWLYGSGFPKHKSKLKPAWEPIIMGWNPAPRAVPLNIDACRIAHTTVNGGNLADNPHLRNTKLRAAPVATAFGRAGDETPLTSPSGRWPANVITDESAAEAIDAQAGERGGVAPASGPTHSGASERGSMAGHFGGMGSRPPAFHPDSGGASRFYYCAKASRREREAGLEGMPQRIGGMVSETSGQHVTRRDGGAPGLVANHHPTVKPIELMRWLCRLVTPAGGRILDPFCGSGSTGVAAIREGFRFVGIEQERDYFDISVRRVFNANDEHQPDLGLSA